MKRQALVVGINQYPFLTDKPGDKAKNLLKPAPDAEAIAQCLETFGDFEVHRLPTQEGKRQVDPKGLVKIAQLEAAIIQLFHPQGNNIPQTGLLFFAGHGLQRNQDGETEGFLATSEASPRKDKWGISLKWLRKILEKSPVRQQLIWLDCCHSGELFNFRETDLGEYLKGRDRSFIAASREFQSAYGGVLTPALLQGLDPTQLSDGCVTNYTLNEFIEQALKDAPQHPILTNTGGQILLTGKQGVRGTTCPYKGLAYFDFNDSDPQYFHGRAALTNQLLEKVEQSSFLAVLGASGSGKSSVVRAGLLHQLKQGTKPGSDGWKIYSPFTPGEHPLRSLEQVIGVEAKQFEALINAAAAERVVLVVDQFEEAFTLCRDNGERQQFFECLMGAVKQLGNKLCLVLVMRADFFGKCAEQEYARLAKAIEQNLVTVLPMTQQELREAITKPAEQVGLEVERELVTQMIADVEGSPGNLPLLQYTLTELWEQKSLNRLVLSEYTRLGGVKEALEKHANKVYDSFSSEEQQVAKRIFLELTQLGEGTENTRRRVRKQDLVTQQQSETIVERVLHQLAEAKLIITDRLENDDELAPVVDIAHEALIRHWQKLRDWLQENQKALIRKQDIEDAAQVWRDNKKPNESGYLLQGTRLAAAEDYLQRYGESIPLSSVAQEYVQLSQVERERLLLEKEERIQQEIELKRQAIEGEIEALAALSEARFQAHDQLRALVIGVKAGRKLQKTETSLNIQSQTLASLRKVVYGTQELNRLQGHSASVLAVSFSPDGQIIASAGADHTIKLWSLDGAQMQTLQGHSDSVWAVSFSPDGKTIASASDDRTLKLWNLDGTEIQTFRGHSDSVRGVSFSLDDALIASSDIGGIVKLWRLDGTEVQTFQGDSGSVGVVSFSRDSLSIASGDHNGTIRVWSLDGSEIQTFKGNSGWVQGMSFSPDGQLIAVANGDGTIKLWSSDGNEIRTFKGHSSSLNSVSFSPDGKLIASASRDGTVRLWNLNGTEVQTFQGHSDIVWSVSFSPDGKTIASASVDGTVKLWRIYSKELQTLQHLTKVNSVSFSPDSQLIASANSDGTIKLWNLNSTEVKTFQLHKDYVMCVSFSPDGKTIASASGDKTIKLFGLDGKELHTFKGHSDAVTSICFSPDGTLLASGSSDRMVKLWKLDGTELRTFQGHKGWVFDVSFSPDGKLIASASLDGAIKLWSLNGNQVQTCQTDGASSFGVSFNPDGDLIASAHLDGAIKLWSLDGNQVYTIPRQRDAVLDVTFSPDGKLIASANRDGTVKIWNLDGTEVQILRAHSDLVEGIRFSPDGKLMASASGDGTVKLWCLNLDALIYCGCSLLHNYLKNSPNLSDSDRHLCDHIGNSRS